MIPCEASWAQTWSMAALPGIPRASRMAQPSRSTRRLQATARSLKPGTVRLTISNRSP